MSIAIRHNDHAGSLELFVGCTRCYVAVELCPTMLEFPPPSGPEWGPNEDAQKLTMQLDKP